MDIATILFNFLILAGYAIGLGAVTVIDIHGFLGQKSPYWTQTTIRAHKVTKPLIWLGIFLLTCGFFFRGYLYGFNDFVLTQLSIFFGLMLNGLFLSWYVSPRLLNLEKSGRDSQILDTNLQRKIFVSFILSFLGWWGSVVLSAVMYSY